MELTEDDELNMTHSLTDPSQWVFDLTGSVCVSGRVIKGFPSAAHDEIGS